MATVEELKTAQANNASATTTPATSTTTTATTATTAPAQTGEDKINAMYDAQKQSQLNQLESAYNQSKSEYTAAQQKIAPEYQNAANALAVEYERNKRNFNQQAAANGLNTGTGSQARLAQNSAYQRDYGGLRTSESEAQAEAARQLANFEAKYQSDVAAAIANNDYQRAAALFDEYKRGESKDLQNAQILAEFGDFSGYAKLYGQDQANNMFYIWASQNPDLALNAGRITQAQRDNIVNGKPINEGLDASGNRIATTAAATLSAYNDPWAYGGSGWNGTPSDPATFTVISPTGTKITGLTEKQANTMQQNFNNPAWVADPNNGYR